MMATVIAAALEPTEAQQWWWVFAAVITTCAGWFGWQKLKQSGDGGYVTRKEHREDITRLHKKIEESDNRTQQQLNTITAVLYRVDGKLEVMAGKPTPNDIKKE
jgi:hypothetical protein